MDFGGFNFEFPVSLRGLARSVTSWLRLVPPGPGPDPRIEPRRRSYKKIILLSIAAAAAAILYFDLFKISRLWSEKVYVACNFRQPGHSAYIRGKAVSIYRFLPESSPAGETTYPIVGGRGTRIARNHFVIGDPNEDFEVIESRCAEAEFDVKKYKLSNICPDDLLPEGDKRKFFVLALGNRKSSPQPTRLQVRCEDDSFDYFEDKGLENPAIQPKSAPPPSGPAASRARVTRGAAESKATKSRSGPKAGCSRRRDCRKTPAPIKAPSSQSEQDRWIGPR